MKKKSLRTIMCENDGILPEYLEGMRLEFSPPASERAMFNQDIRPCKCATVKKALSGCLYVHFYITPLDNEPNGIYPSLWWDDGCFKYIYAPQEPEYTYKELK